MMLGFRTSICAALSTGLMIQVATAFAAPPIVPAAVPNEANAILEPTLSNSVRGTVSFKKVEEGLQVQAVVSGLTPGSHGFHVHERGDCSASDAMTAGEHFNPRNRDHGGPDDKERHAGDFGNLEADERGHASLTFVDSHISLEGKESVLGRSVVVDESADDLHTQPTGNTGSRQACGVITAVKDE